MENAANRPSTPFSNRLIAKIEAGVAGASPAQIGYREALSMLAIHRQDLPGIEEAIDFAIEQYREVHGG